MAHILIAAANYYKEISDELIIGTKARLEKDGHSFDVIDVPGAFELPAAVQMAVDGDKHYDGYIALGCVIRGETTHYDYVCQQCARGLQDIALTQNLAIGFGLLTVENKEQAKVRADVNGKNKGHEAADACLRMLALREQFNV